MFRAVSTAGRAPRAAPEVPSADEAVTDVAWDPNNLLGDSDTRFKGRIEQRLAERRQRQAGAPPAAPAVPIHRIDPEELATGGVPLAQAPGSDKGPTYAEHISLTYMPVNVTDSRIHVLNYDPPVLQIDGFLDHETCDALVATADASGAMGRSKVGAGNVADANSEEIEYRTSSTALVDPNVAKAHPELKELADKVQGKIKEVMSSTRWGRVGTVPPPGGFTFEFLQLAHYANTQHFKPHDDAFPWATAKQNKFQRRATVLMYLNDVATGGATRFSHLGFAVQPKKGRAIVFFPAFNDNKPDERTLHEAEAAVDDKWVAQQWCACGVAAPKATSSSGAKQALAMMQQGNSGERQRRAQLSAALGGPRKGKGKRGVGKAGYMSFEAGGSAASEDEESAHELLGKMRRRKGKGSGSKVKGFG